MKKRKVFMTMITLIMVLVLSGVSQAQRSVEDAVTWAEGQVGSTWNYSTNCNQDHSWANWCGRFVGHAYGLCTFGFASADDGWTDNGNTFGDRKTYNDKNAIPKGALVFFDTNVAEEHVGLYVGEGKVVHAWTSGVVEDDIKLIDGIYLGWRWPDDWTDDSPDITEVNCALLKSFYPSVFSQLGIYTCLEAFLDPENEYIVYHRTIENSVFVDKVAWFNVNLLTTAVLGSSTSVDIPDDPGDSGTTYDGPDANVKEVELSNYGADSYHHTLTVDPGDNIDVRLEITNKGDEDIDYFEVFVHRSPDLDFDEETDYSCGREEEEDDLNDGGSTAKHRTCTAPTTPGIYYWFGYINRVDGEDDGTDQDWDNNYSRNDDPEEYGVLIVRDLSPPPEKKKLNPAVYLLLNN